MAEFEESELIAEVELAWGYRFDDPQLLLEALTHRSFGNEHPEYGRCNQRLEYLGDAVLELAISTMLFADWPDSDEGVLTQLRAHLVNTVSLARLANGLGLGHHLRMGVGEERTGGRDRPTLLADGFEAVVGAIYLDGGFHAATRVIARLFADRVSESRGRPVSNPKSDLQEWSQRELGVTPRYEIIGRHGPDHKAVFVAEVAVGESVRARGEGRSKKQAQRRAAQAALGLRETALMPVDEDGAGGLEEVGEAAGQEAAELQGER